MQHVSIHISDPSCGFYLSLWEAKQIRQTLHTFTSSCFGTIGNMFFFLHDAKVTTIPRWYADLWAKPSFRTQVLARIEILNAYITQMHSKTQFSHDFPKILQTCGLG